jgi:hypothetical protein
VPGPEFITARSQILNQRAVLVDLTRSQQAGSSRHQA